MEDIFTKIGTGLTLSQKIERKIESTLGLSADVHLVEPRTIERTAGKARRVVDNRKI